MPSKGAREVMKALAARQGGLGCGVTGASELGSSDGNVR